jgi:UDP-2-acetamido-2,6-beta-L-arabino-hexul-4-ose reductase
MLKIGITGQPGFIGTHLANTLALHRDEFELIPFADAFFDNPEQLNRFVTSCDTIVHLAAVNRHADPATIYDTNIRLVQTLVKALEVTGSHAHLLFSSSTQETRDNPYGKSKKEGRMLLSRWAESHGGGFTGLVIPNVFGPFGAPFYNSVIATFSHQLNHGEVPKIETDADLKLIYVGELVQQFITAIRNYSPGRVISELTVAHTVVIKVSDILHLLLEYQSGYLGQGIIPPLRSQFEINFFNTFRSFTDLRSHNPVKYLQHTDDRGTFVQVMQANSGGQVSFSITRPGITRGNHFHTRKIERFSVIRGEARIQLRRIGTSNVMDFHLSGSEPSFIDMPVWYTHNITNTGNDDLYTIFWVNEFFDAGDADTWFEVV